MFPPIASSSTTAQGSRTTSPPTSRASAEFAAIFARSVRRRNIGEAGIAAFKQARAEHDTRYRAWLATLTPEDIKTMVVAQEAAAVFEEARARGYRTPHK